MLGHTYRYVVVNTQNQAITVTLKERAFKYSASGVLTFNTEQTQISSQSVAATTGTHTAATVDNSYNLFEGAELTLTVQAASATNGTGVLAVYREHSTDGGTTWPTAGQGTFVGGITLLAADGTTAVTKNLRIR